jgi:hypothetical protein
MSEKDSGKDSEDVLPDERIKHLLAKWQAPEPSERIKSNVMAAYQDRLRQRAGNRGIPWWKRLWMIRMPLPATALIIILTSISLLPLLRNGEIAPVILSPPVSQTPPAQVVEVSVIKEKIITEKIYIKPINGTHREQPLGLRGIDDFDHPDHQTNKATSSQQESYFNDQPAELKAKNGLASDAELEQFLKRKNYLIGATDSAEFLFKK